MQARTNVTFAEANTAKIRVLPIPDEGSEGLSLPLFAADIARYELRGSRSSGHEAYGTLD